MAGGWAQLRAVRAATLMTAVVAVLTEAMTVPAAGKSMSRAPVLGDGLAPPPIIRRVENDDNRVAITFDACAIKTQGYGFDRPVYEVIRRERIPATIFVSGRWAEFHPDAMQELANDPLIEFANHSYDHPHMTKLTEAEVADQLDRTERALNRHGVRSVAFRPPFGEFSDLVLDVANRKQLPPVLWDVVSGDPSLAATAEAMIRTVVHQTRTGSIIIFHINGRETKTASALPPILKQLRERGFRFVHVSTLIAIAESQKAAPLPPDEDATMPLAPEPPTSYEADMNVAEGAATTAGVEAAPPPAPARSAQMKGGCRKRRGANCP